MQISDELLSDFISEAWESIEKIDTGILLLEKTPEDKKNIANVFRAIHTVKGSSGFFALKRIENLSHAAESLLGNIREGQIEVDTAKIAVMLQFADQLRALLAVLDASKQEPAGDDSALIATLLAYAQNRPLASANKENSTVEDVPEAQAPEQVTEHVVPTVLASVPATEPNQFKEVTTPVESKNYEMMAPVKVSVELIDMLMNNVSELVLARNRLMPFAEKFSDSSFQNTVAIIDKLTIELQEKIIQTRMQPIGQLWSKIPRLARDVAQQCGKQIEVVFSGEGTELDRTLLDAIRDPIMHIVRNCIDHGIEAPNQRLLAGKSATGIVSLSACHENGMVLINIHDDGQGIDFDRIRQRAFDLQLLELGEMTHVTEDELIQFLYMPGFSTRSEVTQISGRGVGMDVVKTNVAAIGGYIKISSKRGDGMRCTLRIPLTLAIIPALLVRAGTEFYSIPQINLQELVRHKQSELGNVVEDFHGTPVLRLRDKLIPLFDLAVLVGLPSKTLSMGEVLTIVIVQAAGVQYGVVVDEILKLQEVVIKPLPPIFRADALFSGATILGDGSVSLILDMDRIAVQTRTLSRLRNEQSHKAEEILITQAPSERVKMLLVEIRGFGLSAIPVNYVDRMDKFESRGLLRSAGHDVMLYEGEVVRIIDLAGALGTNKVKDVAEVYEEKLYIVIHFTRVGPFGFIVQSIDQIIELPKELRGTDLYQQGLLGFALINERVVNVLNIPEILQMHGHVQEQTMPLF
ncbi:MAG: chemotaxis protein CheA [Betaproteobacteria bacterium]|nr:chemotaxis protein CheA [Betaproteobacteria bacterium]NBT69385.1 chemotaxis protein CheA [Betaproteobacteria bacterium]